MLKISNFWLICLVLSIYSNQLILAQDIDERGRPSFPNRPQIPSNPIPNIRQELTGIIPQDNRCFTIAKNPTILVYIPQYDAQSFDLQLKIFDKDKNIVAQSYQANLSLKQPDGIIEVTALDNQVDLSYQQRYTWEVTVTFRYQDRSEVKLVKGWLERLKTKPNLQRKLATATPDQIPGIYADAGIWYDAFASLAKLRHQYPDDAKYIQQWQEFLAVFGLETFTNKPILDIFSVIDQPKNDNNSNSNIETESTNSDQSAPASVGEPSLLRRGTYELRNGGGS